MPLPDFVAVQSKKLLDAFCERRIPPHVRDQVRLVHGTRGSAVTLFEMRPPWDGSDGDWSKNPIARFSFEVSTGHWVLRWFDRNSKSHVYEGLEPTRNFATLLDEVDRDPTCIFWG